jgi:NADH-quinone oxidoreductase subunit N
VLALACREAKIGTIDSGDIVAFYLATYLPMTLVCFIVLGVARAQGLGEEIASLRGMARKSPMLALALTLALASLAGLPLTAGFLGKLLVFFAAVQTGSYASLVIATIGAGAGFYYYFKVILSLYSKTEAEPEALKLSPITQFAVGAFAIVIVVLGVYPEPLRRALGDAGAIKVAAVEAAPVK